MPHRILYYITRPSETAVSLGSGFSFAGSYLYVNNVLVQISSMSILEFSITCFKTAVIAGLGGFCGLLGKEFYAWVKRRLKK